MAAEVTKEEIEKGRLLFAQTCDFMLAAADPVQFPDTGLKEVAFIGRSNVGKSSLVNALTGRKTLARTSNTPGRTQQAVFFNLGQRLVLVDLPGYGHAQAPVAEKEVWGELVGAYFRQRRELECVCLLMDSVHGAKASDEEMMTILDRAAVKYQIVLTKTDRARSPKELEKSVTQINELIGQHVAARTGVMSVSSEKKLGIEELRVFLAGFAA